MTPVVKHPNPSITGPLYLQEKVKPERAVQLSEQRNKRLPVRTWNHISLCRCIIRPEKKKKVEIE